MREIAFVAAGGALGAVVRYGVGLSAGYVLGRGFPWGTLFVNVAGCFVMGMVVKWLLGLEAHTAEAITPELRLQMSLWRHAVAIGFLGGLTTFSSFGADTLRELTGGAPAVAIINIAANVVLSLAAVWCGMAIIRTTN